MKNELLVRGDVLLVELQGKVVYRLTLVGVNFSTRVFTSYATITMKIGGLQLLNAKPLSYHRAGVSEVVRRRWGDTSLTVHALKFSIVRVLVREVVNHRPHDASLGLPKREPVGVTLSLKLVSFLKFGLTHQLLAFRLLRA